MTTGADNNDSGYGVTIDPVGNIIVSGSGEVGTGTHLDMVVWRFDDNGVPDTTFGSDYDSSGERDGMFYHDNAGGYGQIDEARNVLLDSRGEIFVVGYSQSAGGDADAVGWLLY